uniref:Uncharacterized protein n=1 Tax=Oryza glumipatula TaxID=40148 RepID=A0A0E0AZT4_9ORYZ
MSRRDSSIGSSAAAAASSTTGGGFSSPFPNLGVPLSSPQSTDPRRHNPPSLPLSPSLSLPLNSRRIFVGTATLAALHSLSSGPPPFFAWAPASAPPDHHRPESPESLSSPGKPISSALPVGFAMGMASCPARLSTAVGADPLPLPRLALAWHDPLASASPCIGLLLRRQIPTPTYQGLRLAVVKVVEVVASGVPVTTATQHGHIAPYVDLNSP